MSWSSAKTELETQFLKLENQTYKNVSFNSNFKANT